jgi:hypothetical protein
MDGGLLYLIGTRKISGTGFQFSLAVSMFCLEGNLIALRGGARC